MKHMKKHIRNIAVMVVIALVLGTVSVSAGVDDNLGNSINKILGPVNASINGSFDTSCTNGKLNQMKRDLDQASDSVKSLLSPYMSSLTVWVDSTDTSYDGRSVSVVNSKGEKDTATFNLKNGHYEAVFSKLIRNDYTLLYPFILSDGQVINLSNQIKLVAGANTRQLFGELQQMSMAEIQTACKNGVIEDIAKVGDTITDGTYTYTIIGINQDKPSDENGNLLDSSQYGDVLTVMSFGAVAGIGDGKTPVTIDASKTPWGKSTAKANSGDTGNNIGGWKSSDLRVLMTAYLKKLPAETQEVIGYAKKITSGGGYNPVNIVTGDKCFLLSGKEIFGGAGEGNGSYCTAAEASVNFQYQYFANIATTESSRNILSGWWLRSPYYQSAEHFCKVGTGKSGFSISSYAFGHGVFPAFCIY